MVRAMAVLLLCQLAGTVVEQATGLTLNQTAGAFGGVAIGLNGIVTSLVLPLLVHILRL